MISILIPVYNFVISNLIKELVKQATELPVPFEVIVIDDDSTNLKSKETNSEINKYPQVRYIENNKNLGRSATRNLLAEKAQYKYLLFMDGDAETKSDNYIKKYYDLISDLPDNIVICGGTSYYNSPPTDPSLLLRWTYGKAREQRSANDRNKNPNAAFSAFNFLISKELFDQIKFDDTILQYGHEDTLLGYEIKKMGISVQHIDNTLIHKGLEGNEIFLQKTKTGITNLKSLYYRYVDRPDFIEDIKLLKTYKRLRKIRIGWTVKVIYKLFSKCIHRNLCGQKPKMFYFDVMKLGQIFLTKV